MERDVDSIYFKLKGLMICKDCKIGFEKHYDFTHCPFCGRILEEM